ncbi:MAG: glycosyltransferase family 4 protein [Candidatus Binatia bacterium]|nr:glycosyltransferase family 4 protein [Candidatus Binatia bacterium]
MRLEALWNTSATVYLLKSLWLFPLAVYLGEHLREQGVTRVHAHWATHATTVALLMHWIFGIRFSFTAHAYDIYLMPILLPAKLEAAQLVVTCARVNAEYLRGLTKTGGTRLVVNYHGVDLQRFSPRARPRQNPIPRIVSCGALRLYKGHHVLIQACKLVTRPLQCVIIGEGPQRSVLEKLVRDLELGEQVQFTGPLVQEQVAEEYAKADLFVLASVVVEEWGRQDVIPNVLVEAMAMEIPVVASDLPGIRELITDGVHGRLVPPGNPRALAEAIVELLDNRSLRTELARNARARVVEDFDRDRNVRELARVLVQPSTVK